MNKTARFGPAGRPDSFTELGYKKTEQLPQYLARFGLDAFEYQCGHGLKVNFDTCRTLGSLCAEAGIRLSLHTPYYISLSSVEQEKRDNSVRYLVQSAEIARTLGADRMVVHSGSCGKLPREEALSLAQDTLRKAQQALDEGGYGEIHICPETLGKVNQLGDLSEVLALCGVDERFIPCIDFGHLNARTFGGVNGTAAYAEILDAIENSLGRERAVSFHAHFSKIEYTEKGGEKVHLTFSDTVYGPEYEPLMELLAKRDLRPTIICESAGTQAEDASAMRECYLHYRKEESS